MKSFDLGKVTGEKGEPGMSIVTVTQSQTLRPEIDTRYIVDASGLTVSLAGGERTEEGVNAVIIAMYPCAVVVAGKQHDIPSGKIVEFYYDGEKFFDRTPALESDVEEKLGAKLDKNNGSAENLEVNKTLTVNGDIIQNGQAYETHAEKLYTKNDLIITRDGATAGLPTGGYSGIQAKKYDGENDGLLVFDKDGTARVGDAGDTQPLLTREEAVTLKDGQLFKWDAAKNKAVGITMEDVAKAVTLSEVDTSDAKKNLPLNSLAINSALLKYIKIHTVTLQAGKTINISSTFGSYFVNITRDGTQYSLSAIIDHIYQAAPVIHYLYDKGVFLTVTTNFSDGKGVVSIQNLSIQILTASIVVLNTDVTFTIQ